MEAGTTITTLDGAAKPAGTVLRWQTPGWFLATDLRPDPSAAFDSILDDLSSLGARGWFVRTKDAAMLKAAAGESQKPVDDALAQWSPQPVFFPENATNPAMPQRLPGGKWWLPSPVDGNRIDLGTQFFAYRSQSNAGQVVAMWTAKGAGRVRLRMAKPATVRFTTLDGSDPQPKVLKNGIEVTMTDYPLLMTGTDEIPIPEAALGETVARFQALMSVAESKRRDTTEERFFFDDNALGFDKNPGGSFSELRRQYWKLNNKVGRLMWIEGERPTETNFSGPVPIPGCCNGSALTLNVPVATTPDGYFATYDVNVTSQQDVEVWMAARIPKEQRGEFRMIVGGESMRITEEPVSVYGQGFAWYKLGVTRLGGDQTTVRLEVKPTASADLAIDAILFYPGTFRPNGTTMPDGIDFAQFQKVQKPKKKKRD